MRKQLVATVENILGQDSKSVLLLGDIGVFGFRNAFRQYPSRVYNIGILEQTTVSVAAGLAMEGFVPIVHTIAPFLIERAFEQIKVDFGYQRLGGTFISVGASYDYSALGCTHHCPGDVAILMNIPGMQIVVPGCAQELDVLLTDSHQSGLPTYFRMSERPHRIATTAVFGSASVIKQGSLATIVVVGPLLGTALEAFAGMDVTILYYTTVCPFDGQTLRSHCPSGNVIVVEPFYEGTLAHSVQNSLSGQAVRVLSLGVPRRFLTAYGQPSDHDADCGLDAESLRVRVERFLEHT